MQHDNYDAHEDAFKAMEVEGVAPPELASLRFLRLHADTHREDMAIETMQGGASMSMMNKLKEVIKKYDGKLNDGVLRVQMAGDGCGITRMAVSPTWFCPHSPWGLW